MFSCLKEISVQGDQTRYFAYTATYTVQAVTFWLELRTMSWVTSPCLFRLKRGCVCGKKVFSRKLNLACQVGITLSLPFKWQPNYFLYLAIELIKKTTGPESWYSLAK